MNSHHLKENIYLFQGRSLSNIKQISTAVIEVTCTSACIQLPILYNETQSNLTVAFPLNGLCLVLYVNSKT